MTQKISECRYYKGLIDTNRKQRLKTTAPPSPPKQIKKSRKDIFPGLFHFRKTQLATKVQQNMQLIKPRH